MPSRPNVPPSIWDRHGVSWNFFSFCKSDGVFFSTSSARVKSLDDLMCHNIHHNMWWVKAKHQLRIRDASQDRQTEIHSFQVRADCQRIMVQTNNDCRFQIFILTKSSMPATFACWKRRFKIEVCICSQFPTETLLWIKEVEMVDSVDDLKSSISVRGIRMPDFEVVDARITSTLDRIIHNTLFMRKVSLEEQRAQKRTVSFAEDRSLTWSTITSGPLGANDSVENHTDLFTIVLRNVDNQDFDSNWDGIFMINDENPTWWHLGRIVQIKNYDILKNSRPYGNCMTWRFIRRK